MDKLTGNEVQLTSAEILAKEHKTYVQTEDRDWVVVVTAYMPSFVTD